MDNSKGKGKRKGRGKDKGMAKTIAPVVAHDGPEAAAGSSSAAMGDAPNAAMRTSPTPPDVPALPPPSSQASNPGATQPLNLSLPDVPPVNSPCKLVQLPVCIPFLTSIFSGTGRGFKSAVG